MTMTLAAAMVVSASGMAQVQAIDTIAFGSCARERQPQPVWTEIIAKDPDLFLFIGDNQYADVFYENGQRVMKAIPNIERLHEAYDMLAAQPGFRRMQRHAPIMATWDDHDYGENDAGKEFYLREESKQVFFDFYGFRENDPRREQPGVYHSRMFGPAGQRVQVIMLDTRYNRDPLDRLPADQRVVGPYMPTDDTSRTILGEEQWGWLEGELKKDADVRIIASSIQVVSDEHGWETWGNMPHERQRLYDLIEDTDADGVVFISGDRHLMEISRDNGRGYDMPVPYPMWDFTSSGMTERARTVNDPNSRRLGPVKRETNFGVLHIHWADEPADTRIEMHGYGDQGQTLMMQTVFLGDLQDVD
ncbi:MAG: alkaline phosphatase D family protein [Planctomycetota bacterium]